MRLARSDDFQPVAWVGRFPVYVSTFLVGIYFAAMAVTLVLGFLGKGSILRLLLFSSPAITQNYEVWRFFTYPLYNQPNLWFLVEMYILYSFGREVERFIGRRDFLFLYGLLLILPSCALLALGGYLPVIHGGSQILNFCIFLAFATLYPDLQLSFIPAKWLAALFLGIYCFQIGRSWDLMVVLWLSTLTTFLFVGRLRWGFKIPLLSRAKKWFMPKAIGGTLPQLTAERKARTDELLITVDSLLDKISSNGIGSLTEKEREQLAKASSELKQRERSKLKL